MIKDLLAVLSGASTDTVAVDAALAMASGLGGHLTVLNQTLLPSPVPSAWGMVPDILHDPAYQKLREIGREVGQRWSERLARDGAAFEVRTVETFGNPGPGAGEHALYSDLAVLALPGHAGSVEPDLRALFGHLLLHARRPVLVVPGRGTHALPPKRVVVGWKPGPAAARAVQDALPLLEQAERVEVVAIKRKGGARDPTPDAAALATHLARHGIVVEVVVRERVQDSTATALLRHCDEAGAQLLVCGGYGHLRLSEWAFGGATRELLGTAWLPVLFSH